MLSVSLHLKSDPIIQIPLYLEINYSEIPVSAKPPLHYKMQVCEIATERCVGLAAVEDRFRVKKLHSTQVHKVTQQL